MLAGAALILGLALGFACGGSLTGLLQLRLRGELLILILFVVQAVARGPALGWLGSLGLILWGLSSVTLLCCLLLSSTEAGAAVSALGIGLNALVILVNRGMPVVPSPDAIGAVVSSIESGNGFYVLADGRTRLAVLGDVLPVAGGLASLGDVLLVVGVTAMVVSSMVSLAGDHNVRVEERGPTE